MSSSSSSSSSSATSSPSASSTTAASSLSPVSHRNDEEEETTQVQVGERFRSLPFTVTGSAHVTPYHYKYVTTTTDSSDDDTTTAANHRWEVRGRFPHPQQTQQWVVLKLHQPSLVGFLKFVNHASSTVEVAISNRRNHAHDYVVVQSSLRLPHHKLSIIRCGFLPCRYVRVTVKAGAPMSIVSLSVMGTPINAVATEFSPDMYECLVTNTTALFSSQQSTHRADISGWCENPYLKPQQNA